MKTSQITSFSGFQGVLEKSLLAYMWRGVSRVDYQLIPKVARNWHIGLNRLKVLEKHLLNHFMIRAVPYLNNLPQNEWEWLALAQHHGLSTRLLDWTRNPLIALYFACREDPQHDGAVYFAKCINEVDTNKCPSPFEINEERKWSAQHFNNRLASQDALFTVSNDPLTPFKKGLLQYTVIKAPSKGKIIKTLTSFGIHQGTIFPGLDGVARYVEDEFFVLRGISKETFSNVYAKKIDELTEI